MAARGGVSDKRQNIGMIMFHSVSRLYALAHIQSPGLNKPTLQQIQLGALLAVVTSECLICGIQLIRWCPYRQKPALGLAKSTLGKSSPGKPCLEEGLASWLSATVCLSECRKRILRLLEIVANATVASGQRRLPRVLCDI